MSSSNPLWRSVGNNFAAMAANAPEGYTPRCDVYLVGVEAPITVNVAESHRKHAWTLLHSNTEGRDDPDAFYASDRYVFVDEGRIERVELVFVRKSERVTGFTYRPAEPS